MLRPRGTSIEQVALPVNLDVPLSDGTQLTPDIVDFDYSVIDAFKKNIEHHAGKPYRGSPEIELSDHTLYRYGLAPGRCDEIDVIGAEVRLKNAVLEEIRRNYLNSYKAPVMSRVKSAFDFTCPYDESHGVQGATFATAIGTLGTLAATIPAFEAADVPTELSLAPSLVAAYGGAKLIGLAMKSAQGESLSEIAFSRRTRNQDIEMTGLPWVRPVIINA